MLFLLEFAFIDKAVNFKGKGVYAFVQCCDGNGCFTLLREHEAATLHTLLLIIIYIIGTGNCKSSPTFRPTCGTYPKRVSGSAWASGRKRLSLRGRERNRRGPRKSLPPRGRHTNA